MEATEATAVMAVMVVVMAMVMVLSTVPPLLLLFLVPKATKATTRTALTTTSVTTARMGIVTRQRRWNGSTSTQMVRTRVPSWLHIDSIRSQCMLVRFYSFSVHVGGSKYMSVGQLDMDVTCCRVLLTTLVSPCVSPGLSRGDSIILPACRCGARPFQR